MAISDFKKVLNEFPTLSFSREGVTKDLVTKPSHSFVNIPSCYERDYMKINNLCCY